MDVSPDGKWYVTATTDGHVTILSTTNGFEYLSFDLPSEGRNYYNVSVSPDAKTLAFPSTIRAGGSHIVRIDVKSGARLPDVTYGDGSGGLLVRYHPQEDLMAAAQDTGAILVLRPSDRSVLFHAILTDTAKSLRFSADGETLAAATANEVYVWRWRENKVLWHADVTTLYAGNLARTLHYNDYGQEMTHTAKDAGYGVIEDILFSPSGKGLGVLFKDEFDVFHAEDGSKTGKRVTVPDKAAWTEGLLSALFLDENKVYLGKLGAAEIHDLASDTSAAFPAAVNREVLLVPRSQNLLINLGGRAGIRGLDQGPWTAFTVDRLAAPLYNLAWDTGPDELIAGVNSPRSFSVWKLATGELDDRAIPTEPPDNPGAGAGSFALSDDGTLMAFYEQRGAGNDSIVVINRKGGGVVRDIPVGFNGKSGSLAFSPDRKWMAAVTDGTRRLRLWRVPELTEVQVIQPPLLDIYQPDGRLSFSPGSDLLAVTAGAGVNIYSLNNLAAPARRLSIPKESYQLSVAGFAHTFQDDTRELASVAFSPDGAWLIALGSRNGHIFETNGWTEVTAIPNVSMSCVAFSPDSQKVALVTTHDSTPQDGATGNVNRLTLWDIAAGKPVFATDSAGCDVAFNQDGSLLAAAVAPGGVGLFHTTDGTLAASLYRFESEHDIRVAPDWLVVTPDGLFDGTPATWPLLSWRFNGDTFDVAPVESFFRDFFHPGLLNEIVHGPAPQAARSIATVDRRQPVLKLSSSANGNEAETDTVNITVAISPPVIENSSATGKKSNDPGARDLRLFRNGTLVKAWRGDLKLDRGGNLALSAEIPIVAGKNEFAAYVFNHDNIKSADATLTINGSVRLRRPKTAYVLAIGINKYAASSPSRPLNLSFAESDAHDFADTFAAAQRTLRNYNSVQTVSLLSENATRANIVAALKLLGGMSPDALTEPQRDLLKNFAPVRPDDGVFIFYAGHGVALDNHFYLLPSDYSPDAPLPKPSSASISEDNLSELLEPISPSRSFLVIDACHSGQALDTRGAAVGPMNSTGLAQLAYEKGLDILAASQSREVALEASQLAGGHGYLTYALVEEGLKTNDAVQTGELDLRPWFEYASRRVPELQNTQQVKSRAAVPDNHPTTGANATQHPRVFYRRAPDTDPFIVAHTPVTVQSEKQ